MKKNIILSFILVISLAGCKKSFLEIPQKTGLSTNIFFKSESDFQQAINGAYAPLRGLYSGNNGAWAMGEQRSDNTTYKYNPNDRGSIQSEYIKDFTDDANSPVTANKYFTDYTIIARANQVLDPIDAVEFNAASKNNIKGQAYFLRAFAYFDLVQYFGQVPIHLKPVTTLDGTSLPLSSVETVYNQIISDAKQAATLLPNKAAQEAGRATSGAAKTLLGNVYVVLKRWAEAEAILKEVTGYSLLSDYNNVFSPSQKNNSESIFEVQFKEGPEGLASNFFYTFLIQPISAAEITAVTGIAEVPRTIQGFNLPTPDMIAAYEPGDKRKDASIGFLTASGVTYPYIKKYAHAHANTNNTNDNWPVYRYAEVLLFLAEAANEQNRPGEALTYLNMVRANPRTGLAPSIAAGQAAVRDAILVERRIELAFENKRWLDLVRTGNADQVMKAFGTRFKANPLSYYFPAGITPSPGSYTNIRLLFPLPASEAALSPFF
ncbi:RagB/SusD family nutrient uptake outer membrane protein [Pedobacter mendelii]|uniref:Membrane protein n=1 Tax=Pedobacter mendelii TaxID=1908240 RepID=A0ABQ2BEW1_9SPHI|nr:RagB/SusD family nutrient uptake outer membrane protein [Pedobacter mendelii]GGI24449.1 membrane protein [Pedobacter mendelii]